MDINKLIKSANKIWLSTHISADGDGLGSEYAFYHALKKINKDVQIIHNDKSPPRYHFITENIEALDAQTVNLNIFSKQDVCFIFDTHDAKLCSPLIEKLIKSGVQIIFVDHHITMKTGAFNALFYIDESASCTGELVLKLIETLQIELDANIAKCLYTSLIFDTQNYKNMHNPLLILDMAKKLVQAGAQHKEIYQNLFETWSVKKFNYLSQLITQVEYFNNSIAIIKIKLSALNEYALSKDEVSDLVDLFMGLKNINISIVIREESKDFYKLSFRGRKNEILSWAREFGGGGHLYSAGAWVHSSEQQIIEKLKLLISNIEA